MTQTSWIDASQEYCHRSGSSRSTPHIVSTASFGSRTEARSISPVLILCLTAMLFFAVAPCFGSGITLSYDAGDGCSGSVNNPAYSGPLPLMLSTTCVGATLGASTTVAAEASLTVLRLYLDSAGATIESQRSSRSESRIRSRLQVVAAAGPWFGIGPWMARSPPAMGSIPRSISTISVGSAFADFRACGDNVQFGSSICYFDAAPNPPGGLRFAQPHGR